MVEKPKRVLTLAPMPPEKCAYALARYSRSPDSIRESMDWVRRHDSTKFLEHFYFQYGHASIADLGTRCCAWRESRSWPRPRSRMSRCGMAKPSLALPGLSRSGFVTPEEFAPEAAAAYRAAGEKLLAGYQKIHAGMVEHLRSSLPRPAELPPDAYQRNLAARAFDVARYLLFLGVPTNVGQVVSITHAGEADPAAAGLRIPGVAVASRGNGRSLRRAAGLASGMLEPAPSRSA